MRWRSLVISSHALSRVHFLDVELQEEQQNRTIQHGIEAPGPNAVATPFEQVQQKHHKMANQVADKQHHLAVHHKRKARSGQPYLDAEPVPINYGVEQGGEKYCQDLEWLGELKPEKWHDDQNRLVEEREHREPSAAEDGEERAQKVEEAREVEGVGPEEDASGGARAEGEAEEPLEGRGGLGAAPEPSRVPDLGGGGEEDADED